MSGASISGRIPGGGGAPGIVRREAGRTAVRAARIAQRHVQARAPKRTGHLARSITVSRPEFVGAVVIVRLGTSLFYAPYIEGGTGLYGPRNKRIEPTHAKALRWPAGGGASLFGGTGRQAAGAAPGFTLAGRQRSGRAGAQAAWAYARWVRGIRPRRFFRDGVLIAQPFVASEFEAGGLRIAQALAGGRRA